MAHICVLIDYDMHIIVDKDVRCQYILIAALASLLLIRNTSISGTFPGT